jgi:tetratricopeptide (TPR) repeat protein
MKKMCLAAICLLPASISYAQVYEQLPVGKHPVGFKIFTITDDARMARPDFNYLGNKNEGDRRVKLSVHLWYPAKAGPGKRKMTYGDYCFNYLLKTTGEQLDQTRKEGETLNRRRSVETWFGKTTDEDWKKLVNTNLLAEADAAPATEKFPLLIGTLRSLSTSITNEMLASNGYVVAMVQKDNIVPFPVNAAEDIQDMRLVMAHLIKSGNIEEEKIGTFGFSGSGFSQVLFAMNDYRIKAVADIESGIYMSGLYENFSLSNYYAPGRLRAPFLHIFSIDLSKQEKYIDDFLSKTKFAKRYRLLLNEPALHHWDFAAEGYTAAILLNNRGEKAKNIRRSFEVSSLYLLNFFNAELKKETNSIAFMAKANSDPFYSINTLPAGKPAPDRDEFEMIIRTQGVEKAIDIVNATLKNDSLSNLLQWFTLNRLGYTFLAEKKYKEAIAIFKLNTGLHPQDANLFDSLSEGYETSGDTTNMKLVAGSVISMLSKKENLTEQEKSLKTNAEKRLQ